MGETERFSPRAYLQRTHPTIRVVSGDLPQGMTSCLDRERRIIWIRRGIGEVERRCAVAFQIAMWEQGSEEPAHPYCAIARRAAAEDAAARWLLPGVELFFAFQESNDLRRIAEILGVTVATLRARLRGLTNDEQDGVMDAIGGRRGGGLTVRPS